MEEEINTGTPVIHTLESDTYDLLQKKEEALAQSPVKTETPSKIYTMSTEGEDTAHHKKVIILSSIIGAFFLLGVIAAGFYMYQIKNRPAPVVKVETKVYTIADVWPEVKNNLDIHTGPATSTNNHIIISITNFDSVYAYIIKNEKEFNTLAKDKWQFSELSDFTDVNVKNNDVRVADAGESSLVYGYAGEKYLIIANSVEEWLSTKETLK